MRLPLLLLFPALLCAQDKPASKTTREIARSLLDSAYEGIGAARPGVQAVLLWEIGDAYLTVDRKKAGEILERAYASAVASQFSTGVESNVAVTMSELDIPRAIEMLRGIQTGEYTHDVRAHSAGTVIQKMLAKRDIDGAIEAVNLLGIGWSYPYGAAESILESMSQNDSRIPGVFGNALNAYNAHPVREFPQLVAKEWRKIPKPMAVQALDAIVRTADSGKNSDNVYSITYSSANGPVNLNSEGEIEVFDILPALQELEPEKAKEVFASMPAIAQAAGLLSHDASKISLTMHVKSFAPMSNQPGPTSASMRFTPPVDSDSTELAIPDSTAAAQNLLNSAIERQSSDPYAARELLGKAVAAAAHAEDGDLTAAIQMLVHAIDEAARMKDTALARRALELTFDMAARQLKFDTDPDDPNPLPLAFWPSVYGYREGIVRANRLFQAEAPAFLDRIKNPDMFLIAQVALGASMLDRFRQGTPAIDSHKKKKAA